MSLAPGTKLGPYEIVAPLGAGGMGEVYRARDTRIGREVAVKILPASFSRDPDRLRRFEQEARAAGLLNHPNILAIYDVGTYEEPGTHERSPYVVSELLEGETLRDHLRASAFAPRKAIDYAGQIARGLAAAHEKGVVHRDLKPENLFVTQDGRVKILDFGLAKLVEREDSSDGLTSAPTTPSGTEPGVVMGTVRYMSPEQVRGQLADHRSDIFSFGTILYEMLTGQQAFRRDSSVETMSAILKDDPPDLVEANQKISPTLERLVRRCLEKQSAQRFQSASDLAFALEALSGTSAPSAARLALAPAASRWRLPAALVALAVATSVVGGFFAGKPFWKTPLPSFQRLTFRRGEVRSARFTPDGQTIVYSASWQNNAEEVLSTRLGGTESRPLGLANAHLCGVSSLGELAIVLHLRSLYSGVEGGTLARVPLAGGAPREILQDVEEADWTPDGSNLAIVRQVGGQTRLEFPIGKTLYNTTGYIDYLRVRPQGDQVAFLDHPVRGDDAGTVVVVDLAGRKRTLTGAWSSEDGLAWSPHGDAVWFTAAKAGNSRALYTVSLSGHERLVAPVPDALTLLDMSPDGRFLLTRDDWRSEAMALPPGEPKERNVSWLDATTVQDISNDGTTVLMTEVGEGGWTDYAVYLRKTDGSDAVRLGQGVAMALSPDGKWALTIVHPHSSPQLVLLPTGPGEPKPLERVGIEYQYAGKWLPDGKGIVVAGHEPGHEIRLYTQKIEAGQPRPITPEGIKLQYGNIAVSPDGKVVAAIAPDGRVSVYPISGGSDPHPVPGAISGDSPIRWSPDGHSLYVLRLAKLPAKVYRLDALTGRREAWKEIMPADPVGVHDLDLVSLTPDGRSYAYSYQRSLADLWLVEGLK